MINVTNNNIYIVTVCYGAMKTMMLVKNNYIHQLYDCDDTQSLAGIVANLPNPPTFFCKHDQLHLTATVGSQPVLPDRDLPRLYAKWQVQGECFSSTTRWVSRSSNMAETNLNNDRPTRHDGGICCWLIRLHMLHISLGLLDIMM